MICLCSSLQARSQTITVLDSFEDNIDAIEVLGGGGRAAEDITPSQHTKADAEDIRVTHGEKCLKLSLGGSPAWNPDALYTFSEENSALIKDAWASRAEARYLLRWDVTFPEELNWGNNIVQLNGNWRYGQCEYGGQHSRTMTIPIDLIDRDLLSEDRITLRILHNFGVAKFNGLEIYIDNIRLVETYTEGAFPATTVLKGFETEDEMNEIIPITERYELALHEKSEPGDVAVTEGENSLAITFAGAGAWKQDFTIPLAGTLMDSIAALPPGARQRYTLRLDVIFGEVDESWNGVWQNFNIRPGAGGTSLGNYSMSRVQDEAHVRTYSLTMDQIELGTDNPGIRLVNQAAWGDAGHTFHVDNLRIIDTGNSPLKIRDLNVTPEGDFAFTWKSSDAQAYALDASADLLEWRTLVTGIAGFPGETTYQADIGAREARQFYRVRVAGAAPPLSEDFESGLGSWRSVTKAGPGTTEWEVGAPADPPGTKNSAAVAGTDLDADYVPGTHVSLLSPEVNLETFTKGPTLSFSYYLALGDAGAFRVNVLDAAEVPIAEAEEGGPLFFTENTEGWVDVSVPLSVFGQKAIIEFEFVAGGSAAGAFIDDVLISESE